MVPALPVVTMPPDLVMFVFLPPLLTTVTYALPLETFVGICSRSDCWPWAWWWPRWA